MGYSHSLQEFFLVLFLGKLHVAGAGSSALHPVYCGQAQDFCPAATRAAQEEAETWESSTRTGMSLQRGGDRSGRDLCLAGDRSRGPRALHPKPGLEARRGHICGAPGCCLAVSHQPPGLWCAAVRAGLMSYGNMRAGGIEGKGS